LGELCRDSNHSLLPIVLGVAHHISPEAAFEIIQAYDLEAGNPVELRNVYARVMEKYKSNSKMTKNDLDKLIRDRKLPGFRLLYTDEWIERTARTNTEQAEALRQRNKGIQESWNRMDYEKRRKTLKRIINSIASAN